LAVIGPHEQSPALSGSPNRARPTAEPVPSRILPVPVSRSTVALPILAGPMPGIDEPTEELALHTAWLDGEQAADAPDPEATTQRLPPVEPAVETAPRTPSPRPRPSPAPRRSATAWMVSSLAGVILASAALLAAAWLVHTFG
jgi:hypothetical protein